MNKNQKDHAILVALATSISFMGIAYFLPESVQCLVFGIGLIEFCITVAVMVAE